MEPYFFTMKTMKDDVDHHGRLRRRHLL